MNRLPFLRPIAPLALLVLGGCALLGGGNHAPVTTYAPQVQVTPDPAWPVVDWQLAVTRPSASRVIDGLRISVRPTPGELEVYRGATWAQSPADMLEDVVLRGFEDSARIGAVARGASGIRSDYRLQMDLRRFESDYRGSDRPAATIEVNAKLIHTQNQRVVAARTFVQVQPAATPAVGDVVEAFRLGMQQVAGEIIGWTLAAGHGDRPRE